jgi:hypothetical protein
MEYHMTILRYVLAMADSIMSETCTLSAQSHIEYRLLVEFYWMLHKIPEYLVRIDPEGCCDKLRFWESKRQASKSCGTNWGRILQVCRRCSAA